MLPNFLCIGAQKSGTTSVAALLETHPDVFFARPRETRFFVDETLYETGIQNYEIAAFGGWRGQSAVGEKTPEYLLFDETPDRVLSCLGNTVRIIVCLRNPAARAFSQFRHNLAMRLETLPFEQALETENSRIEGSRTRTAVFGYRYRGLYARRILPWAERLPREQMLFLEFDRDIAGDKSGETAGRIFRFLGIADHGAQTMPHEGRTDPPIWSIEEEKIIIGSGGHRTAVFAPSRGLRRYAEAARQATPDRVRLRDEEAAQLNCRYWRHDIRSTEEYAGLSLAHWLSPGGAALK